MQVIAKLNYLRMSPRKVREVGRILKGLKIPEAKGELTFISKIAATPLLKLLNSALANAENNFNLKKENLYIKGVIVNEGPTLKRFMPRARGAAYEILKRTSKITLTLDEIKPTLPKKIKVKKEKITTKKISELEESQLKEEVKRKDKKIIKKESSRKGLKGFVKKFFRRKTG